jgi:hypothetical protein
VDVKQGAANIVLVRRSGEKMTIGVQAIRRSHLVIISVMFLLVAIYFMNKYVIFENIDRYAGPFYPKEQLEDWFSLIYPSEDEINSYLADATILLSTPPNTNSVYYFDNHHQFIRWSDNTVEFGNWTLHPRIQLMRYDSRWRITKANIYCHWYYDEPAIGQLDNCYVLGSLDQILPPFLNGRREYRKGNIFGLSEGKSPPLPLPTSAITIDTLLMAVRSKL